ncbi:MAG: ATP-dependent helicase [Clostridiales bacterium]|nr:ATP-dependent helicase [Clostridiales bacterium]
MSFNPSQAKAIHHKDGPMLVLAGPGSGKTLVITERTRYLIEECGISPANILVITFTKAAAAEMKERFLRLSDAPVSVTFGTFHAVFFMILKHAYHYSAQNIIREEQRYAVIKELVEKRRLEYEDENEFVTAILAEIGMVKNAGISIAHYYSKNCAEEVFRSIYHAYQEYLYKNRLIDFEDMLVYTYELLSERGDILALWQNKYRYILIDEFQDINKIQFDVIKLLAGEKKNLFVVGDDDQSIYRFRGAKPEIMLRFREDFPKADMVLLDINYRSSAPIVAGALNLIGHNKERFGKQIRAKRQQGGGIEYAVFENQREQNLRIVRDLQKIMEQGGSLLECAILFRTNTQPRGLMEQLMEYNIPFYTRDSIPNLYEHWIAKDLFAYIRIAQGSRARSDFLKIMNRPKRYISRDSLDEDTVAFDVWEWYYEEQPWVAKRIGKLAQDIKALGRMSPYAAINYIRKGIGYDDFCEEYADYRRMKVEDLYEVLEELQTGAKAYATFDAWFSHIEEYTKELEALSRSRQEQKEGVVLSTLHSAKGLEYETVYMIDVNEGLMPYKKAILPQDIEEERRMFYVGMTRAKKNLHLFSVKLLNNKDAEISRFIAESKETFTPLTN